MGYTKGPWRANGIKVMRGSKMICSHVNAASDVNLNIVESVEAAKSNAMLIAAAPDLLEALIDARDVLMAALEYSAPGYDMSQHVTIKRMDAAISRARGES